GMLSGNFHEASSRLVVTVQQSVAGKIGLGKIVDADLLRQEGRGFVLKAAHRNLQWARLARRHRALGNRGRPRCRMNRDQQPAQHSFQPVHSTAPTALLDLSSSLPARACKFSIKKVSTAHHTDGMNLSDRKLVGVLGGMGPMATADFLAKVVAATPATCDQEHVPLIAYQLPQIPDRSAAILEASDAPFVPMLNGLRRLAQAGAQLAVIPCNTAHYWYDRLAAAQPLRILHIADAVKQELQRRS